MNRGGVARLRAAARTAAELFEWWRTELRDLAQWTLRQLPTRKTPDVLLRVADGQVSVERREGQTWAPVCAFPDDPDASVPQLPAELAGARAALALPRSELYFEDVELPAAAERHLVSALRLHLERRMPIDLSRLLSDHEILATDRKQGRLQARLMVAHRDRVEQLRERAVSMGLAPVRAATMDVDGVLRFNLLRRRRDPVRWNVTPLDLRLMKLAGAAAAALVAVVGAQWIFERAQVSDQVEELRAASNRLRATREELVAQVSPLDDLRAARQATSAPQLLATLSSAVPAPAWFSHVTLNVPADGVATLELTGEVTSRDQVIEVLQAVPGIRELEVGSAFSGELLGAERIEITAQYAPANAGATP